MSTPSARPDHVAVVGRGRLGPALAAALRDAAVRVDGPLGRADEPQAPVVLLCVPDAEIAAAAAALPRGALVGHCSGATGLEPLAPHEGFSLHPLMTITHAGGRFEGVGAAVDATSDRALATATALAQALGMRPVRIAPEDRVAYHAAASIASNFLVTLEVAAERLVATAGADRQLLAPLVRATVETWVSEGAAALTGPISRGDEATVARQRETIAERTPDLLPLFDVLADATRRIATVPA